MDSKILFVDDEANILSSYKRTLHNKFNIVTTTSAKEALQLIKESPSNTFSVVVSDFKMPEMDGLTFLKSVYKLSPQSVRVMLTGFADIDTSIAAINEGEIFRFLTKPCPPSTLIPALNNCIDQYKLIRAEKELLIGTLQGSIKLMSELLSLTNPLAFGQSERIKQIVSKILKKYVVKDSWIIEVAAMLSQIGCSAIPLEVMTKINNGEKLTEGEFQLYKSHGEVGANLIKNIPRLDKVAEIIRYQDNIESKNAPLGSKIINLVKEYDRLMAIRDDQFSVFSELKKRNSYGDQLMGVLIDVVQDDINKSVVALPISALRTGMVVDQDVYTMDNLLLINKGQELTDASIMRLNNYGKSCGVKEPIRIVEQH